MRMTMRNFFRKLFRKLIINLYSRTSCSNPTVCYILLLLLPTVSLAEISRSSSISENSSSNKNERWRMVLYMTMSLLLVNISIASVRLYLIAKFKSIKPSRIFLGKNLIYFCVEVLKLSRWFLEYYRRYEER